MNQRALYANKRSVYESLTYSSNQNGPEQIVTDRSNQQMTFIQRSVWKPNTKCVPFHVTKLHLNPRIESYTPAYLRVHKCCLIFNTTTTSGRFSLIKDDMSNFVKWSWRYCFCLPREIHLICSNATLRLLLSRRLQKLSWTRGSVYMNQRICNTDLHSSYHPRKLCMQIQWELCMKA